MRIFVKRFWEATGRVGTLVTEGTRTEAPYAVTGSGWGTLLPSDWGYKRRISSHSLVRAPLSPGGSSGEK